MEVLEILVAAPLILIPSAGILMRNVESISQAQPFLFSSEIQLTLKISRIDIGQVRAPPVFQRAVRLDQFSQASSGSESGNFSFDSGISFWAR
jgi:hypothetical protein